MQLDKIYKRNTNPNLYHEQECQHNCGSFALGVTGWYSPYITDDEVDEDSELWQYVESERASWIRELVLEGYDRWDIMETVTYRDFEFILKTCPWLRPIKEEEIDPKDRVIAYRLSLEIPSEPEEFDIEECGDFHFRVLIGGEWWEKNGACSVHKVINAYSENWEVDDWLVYDGPIMYAKFVEDTIPCG